MIICVLILCMTVALTTCCSGNGYGTGTNGLPEPDHSMRLEFATQFSVDYFDGGAKLVSLADGSRFMLIPEGASAPSGLDKDITVLFMPLKNIYLAATSAMCLFDSLERLDAISLSGTKEDGWYIPNARSAMQEGKIVYAGKYNQPDYELITATGCPLAIESMMIGHASDIKEQLEALGIAVFMDQSSNEPHPLGRAEWIKLYGALLGEEEKAEELFAEQAGYLAEAAEDENTGKTVAFFYVSTTGRIVARKSSDYVSKMISLAGGKYVFDDLGDDTSKTSTVTLEPEAFYEAAHDADIIIYNATIADEIGSVDEMISKCELLRDFRAVREGNVWCTQKNMYQETTALGKMIMDLHDIFTGKSAEQDGESYFYRLE